MTQRHLYEGSKESLKCKYISRSGSIYCFKSLSIIGVLEDLQKDKALACETMTLGRNKTLLIKKFIKDKLEELYLDAKPDIPKDMVVRIIRKMQIILSRLRRKSMEPSLL